MSKKCEGGFYLSVLEEMERGLLRRASEVEGLDEEIALLRTKLALALSQEPRNTDLLLKGVTVLIRAMAAKTHKAYKDEEELSNVVNTVEELRQRFL